MRLLHVSALGTALVAAGLLAPATGGATALGSGGISVSPGVARPGERVELKVRDCSPGKKRHWATSVAFLGNVTLGGKADTGNGTATVRRFVEPGTYEIVAHCGGRIVTGRFKVSAKRSWPALLPGALNPQAARTNGMNG